LNLQKQCYTTEANPFNNKKEGVIVKYEAVDDIKNYKVRYGTSDNFFQHCNPYFIEGKIGASKVYHIYLLSRVTLEGIDTKNLTFSESETEGTFTGYFAKQFQDPNIPRGHGASKLELPFDEKFVDILGGCFDADISLEDGVAKWEIPIKIKSGNSRNPIDMRVVQEYRMENGVFIISKGGFELCRFDLT
jgi:hypothetical protein